MRVLLPIFDPARIAIGCKQTVVIAVAKNTDHFCYRINAAPIGPTLKSIQKLKYVSSYKLVARSFYTAQ